MRKSKKDSHPHKPEPSTNEKLQNAAHGTLWIDACRKKLQPKADIRTFIGYSPSKKAYRIYNKRTIQVMENNEHKDAPSLSTSPNIETTNTPLNSTKVKPNEEAKEFDSENFTNPFAPLGTSSAESSLRIVDTRNMHTFQQPPIYIKRWTKDHPWCEDVIFNGILKEEVYMSQTKGFVNQDHPNHVFRLKKALYGLKQAPHAWTKHIAVRYHFIKEKVENVVVELYFVKTDHQLVGIFTKALAKERFEFLVNRLSMQSIALEELKRLANSDEE
nr:retrovirus-related Pol polyprotein from transposon TNT 1-94 [Tanacetum cinerariifolium]